jgi:hypothetical protein
MGYDLLEEIKEALSKNALTPKFLKSVPLNFCAQGVLT